MKKNNANLELDDAIHYFELQFEGLGLRFKHKIKKALLRISQYPKALFQYIIFFGLVLNLLHAEPLDQHPQHDTKQYVIHQNTILDTQTKLTWQRCSLGLQWDENKGCTGKRKKYRIDEAIRLAKNMTGHWRLPTVDELAQMANVISNDPATGKSIFSDIGDSEQSTSYWSSSKYDMLPGFYYFVNLRTSFVDIHSKGFALNVRLVKDAE